MRVLSVVYDLDIGGTQRAAVDFANAYRALGHESALLAIDPSGPRTKDLSPHVPLLTTTQVLEVGVSPTPDIIHIHGHGLSSELVRQLHERYSSALFVEQNVFAKVNPWNELMDRTFLFSDWCLFQYEREAGIKAPASRVPNPINTATFWPDGRAGRETRHKLGIPETAFVVGRIGQPQTYKWSLVLIAAFNQWAMEDADAWLLLVGPSEEILAAVASSPVKKRICVVHRAEGDTELRGMYSAMNVFGHAASQGETFGYVLVEAALCEVPAITFSTPWADNSQSEIVGHDVGGLVATTPGGFLRAMRTLAAKPELARAYGVNARNAAIERFDAGVVARAALDAASRGKEDPPPSSVDLIHEYRKAVDPPGRIRTLLFRAKLFDLLAVASGAHSFMWWLRKTLNGRGISRHMLKPSRGG